MKRGLVIGGSVIGGKISVSAGILQGRKITSPLPDLHLKYICKKEGGASPSEVVNEVITAVQGVATKSVASLNIEGLVGDEGKAVEGQLKGITNQIGGGAGDAIEKGAGGVGKALFGK